MEIRRFCLLSELPELRVSHYQGVPPEVADEGLSRNQLPETRLLLLISSASDGVYLYRYADDGTYSGDTWHPVLEEADEQADFEFGTALGEWQEIPESIADPHAYVLEHL